MGADTVLDPAETDVEASIKKGTNRVRVDVLLECLGMLLRVLRAGGRASLLGIPTESVPLGLGNDAIFKGVTVQGIYGRRMHETWIQMTAMLKAGRLKLDLLFGEQRSLENFEDAFRLLQNGFAGKVLLIPN